MESIQTIIGWGVVGFLAVALAILLVAIVCSAIRCFRKGESQKPTIYLTLFAGIFVFVLFSLGMLVLAQFNTLESGGSADDMGSFFALISLCLSLSALVPFFVTKALTERDVEKKVDAVLRDREKQIMKLVNSAESRLHTSDADISRMVGYLLVRDVPDYFWSLSWLARSIKSRQSADEGFYSAVDRAASNLFVKQEMRMIAANLVKIYSEYSGDWMAGFDSYEKSQESRYTGEAKSAQGTLARVLRDYMYLLDDIMAGGELYMMMGKDGEVCKSMGVLIRELCRKILEYLLNNGNKRVEVLAEEMLCRSFKKDSEFSSEKNLEKLDALQNNCESPGAVESALDKLKKLSFNWFGAPQESK